MFGIFVYTDLAWFEEGSTEEIQIWVKKKEIKGGFLKKGFHGCPRNLVGSNCDPFFSFYQKLSPFDKKQNDGPNIWVALH